MSPDRNRLETSSNDAAETSMTTPVLPLDPELLDAFRQDRLNGLVGGTTAVFTPSGDAIYFSKEVLPYTPKEDARTVYHHVGVYAYRRDALLNYAQTDETELEQREGLEQLRFLVNRQLVKCIIVNAKGRSFWELNNPEDVARIERIMAAENII